MDFDWSPLWVLGCRRRGCTQIGNRGRGTPLVYLGIRFTTLERTLYYGWFLRSLLRDHAQADRLSNGVVIDGP